MAKKKRKTQKGQAGDGAAPGGLLARIDRRLAELDAQLEAAEELLLERRRLAAARAALTGERPPGGTLARRLTREELADYLRSNPGRGAAAIARDLGLPATTISQHLHRGRNTLFERRGDGWHARSSAQGPAGRSEEGTRGS